MEQLKPLELVGFGPDFDLLESDTRFRTFKLKAVFENIVANETFVGSGSFSICIIVIDLVQAGAIQQYFADVVYIVSGNFR